MDITKIPLSIPYIGDEEKNAVLEVLDSGWLAHGDYNEKFETSFAKFIGVDHAVTMNSCTSALEICLQVNGIKGGVIVPSFTFVATANAVIVSGATPVFCDVDIRTGNMTVEHIERRITRETEAVIVVHYAGQPCEMGPIVKLCERYGLLLIEDSAETIGATWNGHQAGSFGLGCFSFFPTKNLTCGEGGMLTCNDTSFANKVRTVIAHGISSTTLMREKKKIFWQRSATFPGHNFRMSNVLAAIGYHQLKKIHQMNDSRIRLANYYNDAIKNLNLDIILPAVSEQATHVYQMYVIQVPESKRDALVIGLRQRSIGASVHFDPPVHKQEFYRNNWETADLKNTDIITKRIITLPMYPDLTRNQVDHVVRAVNEIWPTV